MPIAYYIRSGSRLILEASDEATIEVSGVSFTTLGDAVNASRVPIWNTTTSGASTVALTSNFSGLDVRTIVTQNFTGVLRSNFSGLQVQVNSLPLGGGNLALEPNFSGLQVQATYTQDFAGTLASNFSGLDVRTIAMQSGGQSIPAGQHLQMGAGSNIILATTTGTRIGTTTTQKLAFWGTDPIVQPTTGGLAASFSPGSSGILDDTATYDAYTIGQVVQALRNIGILA